MYADVAELVDAKVSKTFSLVECGFESYRPYQLPFEQFCKGEKELKMWVSAIARDSAGKEVYKNAVEVDVSEEGAALGAAVEAIRNLSHDIYKDGFNHELDVIFRMRPEQLFTSPADPHNP